MSVAFIRHSADTPLVRRTFRTPRRPTHSRSVVALSTLLLLGLLLALSVGSATAVAADGPAVASTGPAVVAEGGTNLTVYRARNASFEDADAVEAAIAGGTLGPADELVVGDTLVVAIDSRQLAERMAAAEGSTTERFLTALDGEAEFRLVQTNPSPMVERKVAMVGPGTVTAYRNGTTTYALVGTGDLSFRYPGVDRTTRIHDGERFAVRFGFDLDELPRGDEPEGPVVEFYTHRAEFHTAGYWYEPLPPEWVELSVDVGVEPDDSLVARVRLEDGRTIAAPVDAPGPNRVWLDLRDVDPGTGYVLELVHDDETVDRYEGTVREPGATLANATLSRVDGGAAVGVTVSTSHGGQVQVLDGSCDVVGTRWVAPGAERRLTIELGDDGERIPLSAAEDGVLIRVARHRGTSDEIYRGPAAEATVDFDGGSCPPPDFPSRPAATPSPIPSPTETPTASPSVRTESPSETSPSTTASSTDDSVDEETTTGESRNGGTTGSDGAGFTALAALSGLLAAALVLFVVADSRS